MHILRCLSKLKQCQSYIQVFINKGGLERMQRRNKFWHPLFSKNYMVILFPIQFSNNIQSVLSFLDLKYTRKYFRKTHRLNTLYLIRSHKKLGRSLLIKRCTRCWMIRYTFTFTRNTILTVHLSHNLFRFVCFTILFNECYILRRIYHNSIEIFVESILIILPFNVQNSKTINN